ncbi:hypothetical protein SAMN05216349_10311 [Oribacterium sp. KHPX15]|uniref:hypothetical protein n=1 Tax=unclassified Oribacterium TaxID=2629782 RepID=UPI0004E18815|nr:MULTISPECIES: hypothetical protein [unclassified Oribacterium]SDZ95339.1 hypothetical protein SAMN05216349_10311 [Oribacterium sp. KHPX15]
MGVASLVLGIIAIIFNFIPIPGMGWLSTILAIIGIILGALGRKDPAKAGISTAGMVCSIIGLVISLIFYIACAACVGALAYA